MSTKQAMLQERFSLKGKIAKGKLRGRALKKAIGRVYYLNGQLKKNSAKPPKVAKPVKRGRKPRAVAVDPAQGILPGFLDQVSPKVQELARELVFKALSKALEQEVESQVKKLKIG